MILDSELWKLKYEGYRANYIANEFLASEVVYRAQLFGLGFHGSRLEEEIYFANEEKAKWQKTRCT